MRILIADFEIAKYGGIVEHVTAKVKALKALGHVVDIAQLSAAATTQKTYDNKVKKFEDGTFSEGLKVNSQNGGYEYDEATGYWKNNYYGFFLPPSNRIGVFEKNALERWHNLVENFDLIMWNFMPTKSSAWGKGDFSFWWKFYDLPTDKIKQIFIAHDAYFDVRASNVTALREKILFIECAHIAAYRCCEHLGIPRTLLLNPRYLEEGARMPIKMMQKREIDFFAAHIFKSMKHVDDLIRAVPHFNRKSEYSVQIAGSGIEQAYMVAPTKCKEPYKVSRKRDPDIDSEYLGQKIWDVAEQYGMEYLGQISSEEVNRKLRNAKFAIDPSWAAHYSQYCRTHINGFIIEAMLNGCYPVLRDYRGLMKGVDEDLYDPLFENINAIIIPWNATPKEFAKALKKAERMSPAKYLKDTRENFALVHELFNAKNNMKEVIRLVKGGKKLVNKELEKGKDSPTVKKITKEIMEDFYHIDLPIEWETD
jgi:glycosyltransferase involved in cell wall biosynthesis